MSLHINNKQKKNVHYVIHNPPPQKCNNSWPNTELMTNMMQIFGLFICTQSVLHVSGDVFVHHQEHLTVFTASNIVHQCCCRPVSWTRWNSTTPSFQYSPPMLLPAGVVDEVELHNTSGQQHRWTIWEAVNTVKCSWWWAKTSPETCRADWVQINKPESCILSVINRELY